LSLTASKSYYRERYEPFLPGVYHVPYPYPYRNPTGPSEQATLDYVFGVIDEMLDTRVPPKNIAAFIVEPVLGEGGYVVPPAAYMPRLRALCDQHGILLIADEVQSGYGRTGKMFACEHTGVVPDIMTLAKSIASGLPLSAVVVDSSTRADRPRRSCRRRCARSASSLEWWCSVAGRTTTSCGWCHR